MRPAPPADPPAGEAPTERLGLTSPSDMDAPPAPSAPRPSLGTAARITVVLIALGLLGASATLVLARNPRLVHRHPVASSPTPPRPTAAAFGFTSVRIRALPAARGVSTKASVSVAEDVRASLTGFYASTLTRPATWTQGVPDGAWDAFAQAVRGRAMGDSTSLALGKQFPNLESLTVAAATLDLKILIDTAAHAQATVASVEIDANGVLDTGEHLSVVAQTSFIVRRIDRRWLITGWPGAKLSVEPVAPSVGPSVGPSGGAPSAGSPSGTAPSAGSPTPRVSP
jgi:hypothetical protein